MYGLFGSSMMILGHHVVAILLAKMLIWAPFSQSICTFSFCINPCIPPYVTILLLFFFINLTQMN